MKKLYSTLVTVAVSAALTACGGSNDSDQQLFATSSSVSDSGAGEAAGTTSAATCLLYTSPSPRDATLSRMPSSA